MFVLRRIRRVGPWLVAWTAVWFLTAALVWAFGSEEWRSFFFSF